MEMATVTPSTFEAIVPEDGVCGQTVQTVAPDGQRLMFTIPEGYGPGMRVPISYTPLPVAVAVAAPTVALAKPVVEQQATFEAVVPAGVVPGQAIQAQSPDGQLMEFVVPEGYGPGMTVPVSYTPRRAVPSAASASIPAQHEMGKLQPHCAYNTLDGWEILNQICGIRIKEKVQMMEVLAGFEMPNQFMCSDVVTGQDLFVAAERSDGILGVIGRQVFEGSERQFKMNVSTLSGPEQQEPFLTLDRPFKCTCCCFNRPEVFIGDARTGAPIGSVEDPFACCMMTFDMKDATGVPVLEIDHNPCDCALLCWGCPCQRCQEVNFEVKDKMSGEPVGRIRKQFRMAEAVGMLTGLAMDADQYTIDFEKITNPAWKAIVLGTALFLDYRFFTKGPSQKRENSVLGRVAQQNQGAAGLLGPAAGLWGAD